MRKHLVRRSTPAARIPDPFFRNFDRLFSDDLFRPFGFLTRPNEELGQASWLPAVDVRDSDEAFVFTAELPGIAKEAVEITVEDGVLTLKGERRFTENDEEKNYRRIERAYGSFARSFTLPSAVDAERIEASFDNGLLTVTVPKAELAKARKITIS
jgi:HSP20 family protein